MRSSRPVSVWDERGRLNTRVHQCGMGATGGAGVAMAPAGGRSTSWSAGAGVTMITGAGAMASTESGVGSGVSRLRRRSRILLRNCSKRLLSKVGSRVKSCSRRTRNLL